MTSRTLIPNYEVRPFLDDIAPDVPQAEIARILNCHKNTITKWIRNGMPVEKARELLAWKMTETIRSKKELLALQKAVSAHDARMAKAYAAFADKVVAIIRENEDLARVMDEYQL